MIKNHSFCLRKLRFIAVFLLFYPISLLSIQASEKSDMSNVVSNTAQQTSGILSVKKVNPTTVDVLFSNNQRRTIDFYGENIFRVFQDNSGGILIYSTCTYNTREDEENITWIRQEFGAEPLPLAVPTEWNITGSLLVGVDAPVYRFLPHKTQGEGFFLAALRKPEEDREADTDLFSPKKKKSKGDTAASPVSKENLAIAKSWLASSDEYNLLVNGTAITAFPVYYQNDLALLLQSLRIVQAGTEVAEVKGKDLIPAHGLAMSRLLKTSVFSTEALTYEQAIAYLRKEAIVLPPSVPKGYVLVTYKEIPLGFVKNIGNRANNLYPQEWRIRSGYLPDDIRTL